MTADGTHPRVLKRVKLAHAHLDDEELTDKQLDLFQDELIELINETGAVEEIDTINFPTVRIVGEP